MGCIPFRENAILAYDRGTNLIRAGDPPGEAVIMRKRAPSLSREYTGNMATAAIHAGEDADPVTGALSTNIAMSAAFKLPAWRASVRRTYNESYDPPFAYGRWCNPRTGRLKKKRRRWKGGGGYRVFDRHGRGGRPPVHLPEKRGPYRRERCMLRRNTGTHWQTPAALRRIGKHGRQHHASTD